jgi:hypothetical protein
LAVSEYLYAGIDPPFYHFDRIRAGGARPYPI